MKLFMYCLLLPFATMVVAAPVRVRRENVLCFQNDAVGMPTENTLPENTTAFQNPPGKPLKENDSEETTTSFTDMSEAQSTESNFNSNEFTGRDVSDNKGDDSRDAFKDLDSDEIMISKVAEKDKVPSRKKTNVGPMDLSSKLVRDQVSGEHSGPRQGPRQASRELTDLNREEGTTVDENLSGKQVIRLSGGRVTVGHQRKAPPGRVHGLKGAPVSGSSRDLLDRDSLEDNNGRRAPVGNRGDRDYDETREFLSSETYPIAPPEPSSFSAPAKSRAS